MTMEARRFNEYGMEQYERFLRQLKEDPTLTPRTDLLELPRATEPVAPAIVLDARTFTTKFEAGAYLHERLSDLSVDVLRQDVGLWGWLTLYFFDAVCPPDGNGRRKLKDLPNYFSRALGGANGLIKHLLYLPWRMVQQHGENVDFILGAKVPSDSKMAREWGTRLYDALLPAKVQLGREMYWDAQNRTIRRGATSTRTRTRPGRKGNVRRFHEIFNQLELTYDLSALDADGLAGLLPVAEYGRWLEHRPAQSA